MPTIKLRRMTFELLVAIALGVGIASVAADERIDLAQTHHRFTQAQLAEMSGYTGSDSAKDCSQAKGDLKIAACTEVLKTNPNLAPAYSNRAGGYRDKGDDTRAFEDYQKTIELAPSGWYGFYGRGFLYLGRSEFSKAIADFTKAIELGHKTTDTYTARGAAASQSGDQEAAIADFSKALELDPNDEDALNNRAVALATLGRYESAIVDFSKVIGLNGKESDYYVRRGKSYEALGRKDEAKSDYERALRLAADNSDAKAGLIRLAGGQKGTDAGSAPPGAGSDEKECAAAKGESAVAACSRLIDTNAKNMGALLNRGKANEGLGKRDAASKDFKRLVDLYTQPSGGNPGEQALFFEALQAMARVGAADQNAKKLTSLESALMDADMAGESGDYEAAITAYSTALEIDPRSAEAYIGRGWAYHLLKDYQHAIADYVKLLEIDPKNDVAWMQCAIARTMSNDPEHALSDINKSIELNPKEPQAYYTRGSVFEALGKVADAVRDYRQALSIDAKHEDSQKAVARLGESAEKAEDPRKACDEGSGQSAIAGCLTLIERDPKDALALGNLGGLLIDKGDFDKALEYLQNAIEIDPKLAMAYVNRSLVWEAKGNLDAAIEDANKAIAERPNYVLAYYNRGKFYNGKGKFKKALEDYKRVIEIDPNYLRAYNNIGVIYLNRKQAKKALVYLDKAVALAPHNSTALTNRGYAFEDLGRVDDAITDYRSALTENPAEVDARNRLKELGVEP